MADRDTSFMTTKNLHSTPLPAEFAELVWSTPGVLTEEGAHLPCASHRENMWAGLERAFKRALFSQDCAVCGQLLETGTPVIGIRDWPESDWRFDREQRAKAFPVWIHRKEDCPGARLRPTDQ